MSFSKTGLRRRKKKKREERKEKMKKEKILQNGMVDFLYQLLK